MLRRDLNVYSVIFAQDPIFVIFAVWLWYRIKHRKCLQLSFCYFKSQKWLEQINRLYTCINCPIFTNFVTRKKQKTRIHGTLVFGPGYFCKQSIRLWGSGRLRVAYTGTLCFLSSPSVVGPTARICNKGTELQQMLRYFTVPIGTSIGLFRETEKVPTKNASKQETRSREKNQSITILNWLVPSILRYCINVHVLHKYDKLHCNFQPGEKIKISLTN